MTDLPWWVWLWTGSFLYAVFQRVASYAVARYKERLKPMPRTHPDSEPAPEPRPSPSWATPELRAAVVEQYRERQQGPAEIPISPATLEANRRLIDHAWGTTPGTANLERTEQLLQELREVTPQWNGNEELPPMGQPRTAWDRLRDDE